LNDQEQPHRTKPSPKAQHAKFQNEPNPATDPANTIDNPAPLRHNIIGEEKAK
jgi:hypothetical protein